jgi:hypothetical protein
MTTKIHLDAKDVPAMLRNVDGYSGRQFAAQVCVSVKWSALDMFWNHGSRDTYSLVNLSTGAQVRASTGTVAPWELTQDRCTLDVQPGFVLVRHTISSGKDLGLTFFVHPDNADSLRLAEPVSALTATQQTVLNIVASRISSYRREEARSQGIRTAAYDDAIHALKMGDYLNARGAITTKGKNAAKGI